MGTQVLITSYRRFHVKTLKSGEAELSAIRLDDTES
jgi:hypothetical protein